MGLLTKNTIDPQNFPTFSNTWIDRSHKLCKYTVVQTHAWQYNILHACSWFFGLPYIYIYRMRRTNFKVIDKVLDV